MTVAYIRARSRRYAGTSLPGKHRLPSLTVILQLYFLIEFDSVAVAKRSKTGYIHVHCVKYWCALFLSSESRECEETVRQFRQLYMSGTFGSQAVQRYGVTIVIGPSTFFKTLLQSNNSAQLNSPFRYLFFNYIAFHLSCASARARR